MSLFKKKKIVFIVIAFQDNPKLLDYPKHLPIPATGDKVNFGKDSGYVKCVVHTTEGYVTEIKIVC